jgi:translocation and assembly module TamB
LRKFGKVILLILIGLLLIIGAGVVWLQTASGQDWLTQRAVVYLRQKLQTRVEVNQARFSLPDWIELRGVYIEDRQRDTLLAGGKLHVDLDVWGLLQKRVGINEIQLEDIRLKVHRTLPDTTFNFDFITKAFASDTPSDTTAAPLDMRLDAIQLHNVRLSYRDAVAGADADLWMKDSRFEFSAFNPTLSRYHLTKSALQSGQGTVRVYAPLRKAIPEKPVATSSNAADSLDIQLDKILFEDYVLNYTDEVQNLKTTGKIGKLAVEAEQIFLQKPFVALKSLGLENTDLSLHSGDLHLAITRLNTQLDSFRFLPDQIVGKLKSGSFVEKRGFVLRQFRTDFLYTRKQTSLQNLFLQTNETVLQDRAVLRYQSLEDFSKNIGNVGVEVHLKKSQLGFKDVLTWVPSLRKTLPFKKNPSAIVKLSGLVIGKVNNLLLKGLEVSTLENTRLRMDGRIAGLPDVQKMALNLTVNEFATSKHDLQRILPDSALPKSVETPAHLLLAGTVKGGIDNLYLDTRLTSDLGGATFVGNLKNFAKAKNQNYDGTLSLQDFDAGKFLKQPPQQLGKLSLTTTVTGQGIDPKNLQAELTGKVERADVNGYLYQNLQLKGSLRDQIADIEASIADSNATLRLVAKADLSTEYPAFSSTVDIEKLNLKPLNLYADPLEIKGKISANFASTNPEDPRGKLYINDGVLVQNGKTIPLKNVQLELDAQNGERLAVINAPFLKAKAAGVFRYAQLADIMLTEINRYFALPDVPYKSVTDPYRFRVEGRLSNDPVLQAFVPELTRLDTVRFIMQLDSQRDTTLMARITAPLIEYDSIVVNNADFAVLGAENQANYIGHVDKLLYDTYQIKRASIDGQVASSVVNFNATFKDSLFQQRHGVAGKLLAVGDNYRLQLAQNGLLLDYKNWQADSSGYVQLGKQGLLANQFRLQQDRQRLFVNSATATPNGPLRVEMDSLNLHSLLGLVADSLQISGMLGGNILLQNYAEAAVFTGDVAVKDFTYTNIPIGDVAVKATNESASKIVAEATLKNAQNDVRLSGNYLLKNKKPLDFNLDIRRLSAQTIEAFSDGLLRRASGAITGKATIQGATDKPQIEGEAAFDSVAFNITKLGAMYRINNSRLQFKDSEVLLRKFIVSDSLNQPLQVDGKINLANLPNVAYDLDVVGKDFTVLNATRKENDFFYGKGVVDANLHVVGVGSKPAVDGSVKLKQGSDITVIMPDDDLGQASNEEVVEFVNRSNPNAVAKDSVVTENALDFGSEISLNLEADDRSQLTIVVDELNGDNLKVKGNAQLNAGVSANGQPYILGLYELTEGAYNLTLEVLKREFTIQKGSRLLWTGDPMKADVDITAVYPVTTELTALQEKAVKYGKVPLEVLLKIQGSLDNAQISFDVRPDPKKVPANVIAQIENDGVFSAIKGESLAQINQMNKQVFSLLLINTFLGEQSSDFFSTVNPELIARQSVSKLLTDQLNLFASDLIKGVKLDFNFNSTSIATDNGSAGQTDLSVGLSKAFLNDRLTVNVGRNFEIESGNKAAKSSEIVDNVNVNYNLSRDGHYAVRAYRKNQYQSVLELFVVETGVSFSVVLDYEKVKEIFKKVK